MDVDTGLLRCFVAVAEERNLTRAAALLYLAQPTLTRQIRRLERELGVALFVRSRAGMALTEAGRVLLERATPLLRDWDSTVRAVRAAAASGARTLRVGYQASHPAIQRIVNRFEQVRPEWTVELRQPEWTDLTAGLADAEVDVALLRLPFPGQETYHVKELFAEPRWAMLAADHPLAGKVSIPFPELCAEPFVTLPRPSIGADHWLAADERDGGSVRLGAVARNPEEWVNAVARGTAVSLVPAGTAQYYPRPDIAYRPVTGVGPSRVGVAWPDNGTLQAVPDFVSAALACCPDLTSRS